MAIDFILSNCIQLNSQLTESQCENDLGHIFEYINSFVNKKIQNMPSNISDRKYPQTFFGKNKKSQGRALHSHDLHSPAIEFIARKKLIMIKNVKRKLAKASKATTTDVLIRFTDEEFMTVKKMTSNIPIAHVADDIYSLELSSVKYLLEILTRARKYPQKKTDGKSSNGKSTAIEGGDTAAAIDMAIS